MASDRDTYSKLQAYVLTEPQLKHNAYPRPASQPGAAIIHNIPFNHKDKGERKICEHCDCAFIVKSPEEYPKQECIYHYGQCWNTIDGISYSTPKYSCCKKNKGAPGCSRVAYHVHKSNTWMADQGYVTTKPTESPDSNNSIYSLGCEMVSIKYFKCHHDELISFSGLTEKDFEGVTTTLEDVQDTLLDLINDKTILIGHGLHHDLHNLRITHSYVIDTTVVFPHKRGHPYKRSLKNLTRDKLGRNIQVGKHDSEEDASACMDLMLQKIDRIGNRHLPF